MLLTQAAARLGDGERSRALQKRISSDHPWGKFPRNAKTNRMQPVAKFRNLREAIVAAGLAKRAAGRRQVKPLHAALLDVVEKALVIG